MNARPDLVTTDLSLHLVVPGGAALPVGAGFRYDAADPYAVHVAFHTGNDEIVEWTFARQLLVEGVTHPVGEGDVQVWPSADDRSRTVCLSLTSPSGSALFEIPLPGLVEFLTRTYTAVPTGSETDFVDIDAELALLVWSDPQS
jgi:hypothetical protein